MMPLRTILSATLMLTTGLAAACSAGEGQPAPQPIAAPTPTPEPVAVSAVPEIAAAAPVPEEAAPLPAAPSAEVAAPDAAEPPAAAPPAPPADDPKPPVPAPAPEPKPPVPPPAPEPAPPVQEQKPADKPPADAPPAPSETPANDPAAEAASNAKAREILAKAAELQNAGDLAEPGHLQSFHVVFHKATFERDRTDDKGQVTSQMVETDEAGLVFDWKQGSIKTAVTIDGATTTKAWYAPRKIGWINDGTRTSLLLGAEHKADYDQLQFHRTIINQLLDVAILGKMLNDKSRWRALADSAPYEKTVALQRIPPEGVATAVPITLWIAEASPGVHGDVIAASMPPLEEGGATMFYRFSYNDVFPKVRTKSGDAEPADSRLRFPFGVTVYEQAPGADAPRKVLEVFTRSVDVNTVVDADFVQPKSR